MLFGKKKRAPWSESMIALLSYAERDGGLRPGRPRGRSRSSHEVIRAAYKKCRPRLSL